MRAIKFSCIIIAALFITQFTYAQKKTPKKTEITPVHKFKAPKLQCFLDNYKDSVAVSVTEGLRIIGLPLKIYDNQKNEYSISSYQFLYKKRGVREEDEKDPDAKPIPTTTISSDWFKVTPLPGIWVNLIKEQLKSGEELYFFDVIAKDTQGRVMFAPNLKITIQ